MSTFNKETISITCLNAYSLNSKFCAFIYCQRDPTKKNTFQFCILLKYLFTDLDSPVWSVAPAPGVCCRRCPGRHVRWGSRRAHCRPGGSDWARAAAASQPGGSKGCEGSSRRTCNKTIIEISDRFLLGAFYERITIITLYQEEEGGKIKRLF